MSRNNRGRKVTFEYWIIESNSKEEFLDEVNKWGEKGFKMNKHFISPPNKDRYYSAVMEKQIFI